METNRFVPISNMVLPPAIIGHSNNFLCCNQLTLTSVLAHVLPDGEAYLSGGVSIAIDAAVSHAPKVAK